MNLYFILESEFEFIAARTNETAVEASVLQSAKQEAPALQFAGKTAIINVKGVLEPERDAWYDYWSINQTAYSDIRTQILEAKEKGADKMQFNINSGGGNIEGMLETMKAISGIDMPTVANVSSMAASAAYMLASQCDTIECNSELDIIGSNGVATSVSVNPNRKQIANTSSPNKRPNVETAEGVKVVEDELEGIYDVIVPYIASGRNTTIENVKNNFGKGGTMTAVKAKSKGMIDNIIDLNSNNGADNMGAVNPDDTNNTAANAGGDTTKGDIMNINTLKAQHPDVYQTIFDAGVQGERRRCQAHMKVGASHKAMETAAKAIEEGSDFMDPLVQASYMEAALKLNATQSRVADNPNVPDNASNHEPEDKTEDEKMADAVADAVCAKFGSEDVEMDGDLDE